MSSPLGNANAKTRPVYTLARAENGRAHYVRHVRTLSDYETIGTYQIEDDLLIFNKTGKFSCAHPNIDNEEMSTTYARFRRDGDELWLSVRGFGGGPSFESEPPAAEPSRWIVFRPMDSYQAWRSQAWNPRCISSRSSDGTCHPGCSGENQLL